MADYEDIQFEERGDIGIITIDRPDKANTIRNTTAQEVLDVINEVNKDYDLRALIFTGEGKGFSAGIDVGEFEELMEEEFEFQRRRKRTLEVYQIDREVEKTLTPTIAAVNGYALGGGFELALACDLIVASEDAQFGFPEAGLGGVPGAGGTQRLPRSIPKRKAKEMIFTGNRYSAEEMSEYGLINKLVATDELIDEATSLAEQIANNAPISVMSSKLAIDRGEDISIEKALEYEDDLSFLQYFTEDREEGLSAFREDREPDFKGK